MENTPVKCPCCNKGIINEIFDFCEVCNWQRDEYQAENPEQGGCANIMSLNEAREAYKKGEKIL